jgi:hypothetical protein
VGGTKPQGGFEEAEKGLFQRHGLEPGRRERQGDGVRNHELFQAPQGGALGERHSPVRRAVRQVKKKIKIKPYRSEAGLQALLVVYGKGANGA